MHQWRHRSSVVQSQTTPSGGRQSLQPVLPATLQGVLLRVGWQHVHGVHSCLHSVKARVRVTARDVSVSDVSVLLKVFTRCLNGVCFCIDGVDVIDQLLMMLNGFVRCLWCGNSSGNRWVASWRTGCSFVVWWRFEFSHNYKWNGTSLLSLREMYLNPPKSTKACWLLIRPLVTSDVSVIFAAVLQLLWLFL